MTRKSAFTIAAGIAAALVAGLVAVSINMGILQASGDPAGPGRLQPNPIVKTEIRTVHHRLKPKKDDAPVKTVVIPRPATVTPSTGSASGSGWSESEHESGHESGEHQFGEHDDD